MRILIIGAGKSGEFLAEKLHEEHSISMIELRRDRVERVRAHVPECDIFEGDACEPEVLEMAGIAACDLVAAVTGDDEDNLVVAMLAKHYGVETVCARVNHPANEWLYDGAWGVDVAVSSPAVIYGLIQKQVGFGDLITLLRLQADGVTIEELTVPGDATCVGQPLSAVALPANVTVMAILSMDGRVQAARGETVVTAGDQLLLLVEGDLTKGTIIKALGFCEPADSDSETPAH